MNRAIIQTVQHSRISGWLTHALVALFMMQTMLSYLAAPAFVLDQHGRTLVVCTLQGTEVIKLDDAALASQSCPALELQHLLSHVPPQTSGPVIPRLAQQPAAYTAYTQAAFESVVYTPYLSRAPPDLINSAV